MVFRKIKQAFYSPKYIIIFKLKYSILSTNAHFIALSDKHPNAINDQFKEYLSAKTKHGGFPTFISKFFWKNKNFDYLLSSDRSIPNFSSTVYPSAIKFTINIIFRKNF